MTDHSEPRDKLGLALAGGGFRASLFHIGVLRRLAELDMLRYVETLSTVSGGSIVGALYILLLKRELDKKARLDQSDYIRIVEDLENRMCKAIKKNLRVRLFINPFGMMRVLLTEYSLGLRMSRLYERCIYKDTIKELESGISSVGWIGKTCVPQWFRRLWGPGRICLSDIKIRPGQVPIEDGIEAYNRKQVSEQGSVVTQLIINATSLNSGARFWFSATEVGDWDHGNIRKDEIPNILKRKTVIGLLNQKKSTARDKLLESHSQHTYFKIAGWWSTGGLSMPPSGFEALNDDFISSVIRSMCSTDLGKLRVAKVAAWYLYKGVQFTPPVTGGATSQQHLAKVVTVISEIAHIRHEKMNRWLHEDANRCQVFLEFVYELFLIRIAEKTSKNIQKDWDNLTLGQAVGASANFPPVFPPFQITGIYDDISVSRLGLTDGGVFDNIGITGLLDEHCNHIIASDTGGLLYPTQRSSSGRLGMSSRILSILTNREAAQTKAGLLERYRDSSGLSRELAFIHELDNGEAVSAQPSNCKQKIESIAQRLSHLQEMRELHGLAMFTIDSDEVQEDETLPIASSDLQNVRTDLDAFGDIEMYALMNQGYKNTDHYIRRYMNPKSDENIFSDPKDRFRYRNHPYPYTSSSSWSIGNTSPWHASLVKKQALAQTMVKAAKHRFFRALRMKLFLPWAFTLAMVGLFLWYLMGREVSFHSMLHVFSNFSIQKYTSVFSFIPDNWAELNFGVLPIIGVLVGTVLVIGTIKKYWFFVVDFLKQHSHLRTSRLMAKLGRWPQSYKGNLFWFVWAPLPIIAVTTMAIFALFSHFFYHYPMLRKTRIKQRNK